VRKTFRVGGTDYEVLKGITVSVKQGEFVIIFGPSGCGKSTLLHTILGLEEPTSGKVTVENQDFYGMSEDDRALYRRHKIGMIYQQPLWVHSLNVIDNVAFPLNLLNQDPQTIGEKAKTALEKVGLSQWATYTPTELSSGQQQKISLARALMAEPSIIVADEPTGNLDTVSGQELLNTFIDLVKSGKSIVMVTHDLEYLKYATKVFHMIDGQVVEEHEQSNSKGLKAIGGKKDQLKSAAEDLNVRDPGLLKKLQA
jgi:putative ABC transport system ATP-binding protein